MPKLAIGVLASKAPGVLRATIDHWSPDTVSVYVHVDRKFDISHFDFIQSHPNVMLCPHRLDIRWAGFRMVQAELELMRTALERSDFEYFMLHSDDSVPLLPDTRMIEILDNQENWTSFYPTNADHIRYRYNSYVCYDVEASNPLAGHDRSFKVEDFDLLFDLRLLMERKKVEIETLYYGSQWKCIKRRDVELILAHYEENTDFRRSFKFSSIPDESYIHTILGNSDGRHVRNYMWADFSRQPSPYVFNDPNDFNAARGENYFFVRKIHDPSIALRVLEDARKSAE